MVLIILIYKRACFDHILEIELLDIYGKESQGNPYSRPGNLLPECRAIFGILLVGNIYLLANEWDFGVN